MFRFIVRLICVPDYCQSKAPKTYFYTPELYRKRYKFRVLIKLDQAEELEHITDWSDIWHNFDVVYSCRIRSVKERNCDRKKIEE